MRWLHLLPILVASLAAACAPANQVYVRVDLGEAIRYADELATGSYKNLAYERELAGIASWLEANSAYRGIVPPPVVVPPSHQAFTAIMERSHGPRDLAAATITVCDESRRLVRSLIVVSPDWRPSPRPTAEVERILLRMILVHELVHHAQAAARGCVDEACALEDEAIRLHMALVRNDLPTAPLAQLAEMEKSWIARSKQVLSCR